jgi:Ezrin/radixin/moesin family.
LYISRDKLQLEIAAREKAEKKHQESVERLKQLEVEMAKRDQDLMEAQEMIRRLEEQLKQLQAAKEELEARQTELQVRGTVLFREFCIVFFR